MNPPNNPTQRLSILIALIAMLAGTIRATTITTYPTWDGSTGFTPSLGEASTGNPTAVASYGQFFVVPDGDNLLVNFSIWMRNTTPNDPLVFGGYVIGWGGQRAYGPILYQSGPITLNSGWQEIKFDSINLPVTETLEYAFIVSVSQYSNGHQSTAQVAGMPLIIDPYSSGLMEYQNNGTDLSKWTTEDWTHTYTYDTIFTAEFAAVPDPPRFSVFAIGLAFLAFEAARRKYIAKAAN